jgi:dihydropteroate synthase
MGVLNVTPDSFSDGGKWLDPGAAVAHGLAMSEEGAAIIDVGGESTRPGAEAVPVEEELRRVLPVVSALAGDHGLVVSIDTRKYEVAERAIDAGAVLVNDTLGEAADPQLDAVVARRDVAVAVMHSRGTPATMRSLVDYADVVADVREFLVGRAIALVEGGVSSDSIVVDPGIGFAKTPEQNLKILHRLEEVAAIQHPLLVGTSRKSFIGAVLDLPEDERVEGTIATSVMAVIKGARLIRVHDVLEVARAIRMTEAVLGSEF